MNGKVAPDEFSSSVIFLLCNQKFGNHFFFFKNFSNFFDEIYVFFLNCSKME